MKAVVMAGGEGARLRPLTSRMPKPLVPVLGTPVLEHILRLLREHGITEVVVTLAYLGAEIRNRLGDGADLDMEIEYVVEDRPLGTAGSVRNAAHLLDDTFLVISGDALTDIDLTKVMTVAHGARLARDDRAALGPEPARVRRRRHRRRGQHQAFPREAVVGRGLQRSRQHRHLRHRAEGARPHQARHERRLVAGRLPDDAAAPRAAARHRRRRLLDGHRVDPVVPAGQLGRARRQGALPHPRTSRGQRLDGGGRRDRHRRAARRSGVHRRRGEAQGRRDPQRARGHRQVQRRRRQHEDQQQHRLAALVHRRAGAAASGDRLPQRDHQERLSPRGELGRRGRVRPRQGARRSVPA